MAARVGDRAQTLGCQLIQRPAGGSVRAEGSADRIRVRHVQIIGQLPLGGLCHVQVTHKRAGLGQVVQGVHGAPVAALDDLLRLLVLPQCREYPASLGGVIHVNPVGLLHGLRENSSLLRADLLHDQVHLLDQIRLAGAQRLRPVALPLGCGGDAARLHDPAHHVPQDPLVQFVPRGGQQPGVCVDLLRRQHGVTRCLSPSSVTSKPSRRIMRCAS